MVVTRAPGTSAWGEPVPLGANDRADRHANVAFAADGALIAAWDNVGLNSSGSNVVVMSARSTDGGATFSAPAAIAAAPVGMGQYPKLGLDPGGAVRVVWYDSRSSDWRWRVMTAVNDAFGNWMQVRMLPSRGVNTWPATDGGAIVFASTRNAARLQRDATQQIMLLATPARPDPFTFIERAGVATNVFVTSESKTVTGFAGTLPVTIDNGGQYSIDGGPYVTAGSGISAGQVLRVRHVSASTPATAKISTVAVGPYRTPFKSVTTSIDRTPDPFTFGTQTGVAPGVEVESQVVTPTGFNAPIAIQPGPGASYRIDGGQYVTGAGTLQPGQSVQVKHLSNPAPLGYTKTSLKLGGVTGYFTTRTR
jgi:hypothetical protein